LKTTALSRLLESMRRPPHDKRPSTEVFPDIDVNRLASEMRLDGVGRKRGSGEEPATITTALDEVETRVLERVEAEKKRSHALVEDELRTYSERLSSLDFEARFASIRQAAPACVSEFKAAVAKGLDELHGLRRDLREIEDERDAFRSSNKLKRTARLHGGAGLFLKWALILVLFVVEAGLNGTFLAKGSEQGLVGGFSEAVTFALLNIGVALLLALFGAVQLNHRSWFRKLLGLIAVIAFVAFALALNLALAHYREVAGTVLEGGGQEVVARLRSAPLAIQDLQSWILFGMGSLFAVIAFLDGLWMYDPYPGYAALEQRLITKREAYITTRADLIDELREISSEFRDKMDELAHDLSVRRSEHDAIIAHRARLIHLFHQHQAHLERAANVLLQTYREANVKARSTEPPTRFALPHSLEKVEVAAHASSEWDQAELRQRVTAVQDLLTEQVLAIHRELEIAIERYRQLDELVPETIHGSSRA
jgi:hypothetical protein